MLEKADADDFAGRFREIVSDPLNLAIQRDPRAGYVDKGYVYLHNGLKVPVAGPDAYYGDFSSILVVNRGVHEPLEEFVFQQMLPHLPKKPKMLELGAYWGHYSMWLKSVYPKAAVYMVEPEMGFLNAGRKNFAANKLDGDFTHAFVGRNQFEVDDFLAKRTIPKLDLLHADIQGYECQMLEGCRDTLAKKAVDYVFVSTHSQDLHKSVCASLTDHDYRIEVSSDFDRHTTAYDGLVFATSPNVAPVFENFRPMGRIEISKAPPAAVIEYIARVNALLDGG